MSAHGIRQVALLHLLLLPMVVTTAAAESYVEENSNAGNRTLAASIAIHSIPT